MGRARAGHSIRNVSSCICMRAYCRLRLEYVTQRIGNHNRFRWYRLKYFCRHNSIKYTFDGCVCECVSMRVCLQWNCRRCYTWTFYMPLTVSCKAWDVVFFHQQLSSLSGLILRTRSTVISMAGVSVLVGGVFYSFITHPHYETPSAGCYSVSGFRPVWVLFEANRLISK